MTYTAIPRESGALLNGLTADGESCEGRPVAILTKIAVREFLQRLGKVDDKGRPPPAT